ncbi:NrsF family protein [Asticcacaulis sp. BYS171W]|uniref:NrsF family protein n=1 Tax=Asticcacaulis aquaticus TaxID=2984212 RepID=A0ABT5HW84_9CAUL|nr:NrsF family protein [Asticcacaulis aquaticus]MDC7684234.1 NrsF family protein [Asticcacaulis aquaticus]
MSDPHDDLIDSLASGLTPTRPLVDSRLWLGTMFGLVLAILYVSVVFGIRPELKGLWGGQWPDAFTPIGKPLLFLLLGLTSLWTVTRLSRPQGEMKLAYWLPVAAALSLTLFNMTLELARDGWQVSAQQLNGGVVSCFSTILCGGLAGLAVLWRFWLRRAATTYPTALAAISALMCASLMASAYALHCNMDAPVYIVLIYGLAVALFTGVSTLAGRRLLSW